MIPILHPRFPEAARSVRLSRMLELTGTEKTAETKVALDSELFDFARLLAPDVDGLEKTATGLLRLAAGLSNFEKKASISAEDAHKLAAIGVIEDTLGSLENKLACETRQLNRGYGIAVVCDLLKT